MKLDVKIFFAFLLIAILAVSCGGTEEPAGVDVDTLVTAGVGTMVASFFETQTAMITPATMTPLATATPLPSFTPYPTGTPLPLLSPTFIFYTATFGVPTSSFPTVTGTLPTATINSGALASGCNNLAFIRDVNLPSGTVVGKNEEIAKTWKVQNIGTCEWKFQYRLTFLSGDDLRASGDYIRKQVAVWDWSEVSVSFTSPSKPGTYTSYFRMVDGDGKMFGATLSVSFVVQ
ncbi:MAG: hypothetical protein IH588_07345 [Anaerolineales bacterium]|nr:hypothetical protein [Anaerolineales bacterium]